RNRTDQAVRRRLDAGPLGPARWRIGRLRIICAPQRLATCQDAVGVVRIQGEGRDEERSLVEGIRDPEWLWLPIPEPGDGVKELATDVAVAHGIITRRTVQVAVDIEEDVLPIEDLRIVKVGAAEAAVATEDRLPLLRSGRWVIGERPIVLGSSDDDAARR